MKNSFIELQLGVVAAESPLQHEQISVSNLRKTGGGRYAFLPGVIVSTLCLCLWQHAGPPWRDWRDVCRGLVGFIAQTLSTLYRLT